MKAIKLMFGGVCALVLSSCSKEEVVLVAPVIEFVSLTPASVTELVDELTLKIKYSDPDGDLGENSPDVTNLFITDSRTSVKYAFRVQQLAPDNAGIAIEGSLSVNIDALLISDGSTSETGTFSILIKDRAGNESNTITSSAFTIVK
tara:strand:- start:96 stop:536 length:441 start_codon:yes stop_codon:yes gene_type:complete